MITKPTKYTEEFVKAEVSKILNFVLENKNVVYIGEVFENLPYPRENWSRWLKQFSEVDEIAHTIKRVDEILETRINTGILHNKLNPTAGIFNLKNNYGWKDKQEIDQNNTGDVSMTIKWQNEQSQSPTSQENG